MNNPLELQYFDVCHKCKSEGIFLENFFNGENYDWYYECRSEDCITDGERTHWKVTFELNPIDRENDQ